jgi:hypothetical protein
VCVAELNVNIEKKEKVLDRWRLSAACANVDPAFASRHFVND